MYDPQIGRFLTPDPSGEAGGFNLYEYCDGDPINEIDPDGLAGESVVAAEGRVKGAAIEEIFTLKGFESQVDVKRIIDGVAQDGVADLQLANNKLYEIGPASRTGVPAKLAQLTQIPAGERGQVFLYRQLGAVPVKGDSVEYARLTAVQAKTVADEIKAGTLAKEAVWNRVKQLAGKNTFTTAVSEKAAAYAGRTYLRGQLIETAGNTVLNYESRAGAQAVGTAATRAAAAKTLLGVAGGMALGVVANVLTAPETSYAAEIDPLMGFTEDDILYADARSFIERTKTLRGELLIFSHDVEVDSYRSAEVVLTRRELETLMYSHVPVPDDSDEYYTAARRFMFYRVRPATPDEIQAWHESREH